MVTPVPIAGRRPRRPLQWLRQGLLCPLCLLLLIVAAAAETYDDRLAATDRSDPDSLYELVVWCRANGFHTSANQHIREILALDANHAPTRELQGFVWTGNRWVHQSRLPPDQRQRAAEPEGPRLRRREASGPGPKAADIQWDMSIPEVPAEEKRFRGFLTQIAERMNRSDIFAMEGDWRTMIRPEHRHMAIAVLAEKMHEGSYRDLWGPSQIAKTLYEEGDDKSRQQARSLLPFLVHVAKDNRNADGLLAFTYIAGVLRDKRVVPTLIDILANQQLREAHSGARQALSRFMLTRERDINPQSARDWWARFHNVGDSTIYVESLNDPDPWVRLEAVRALSSEQWDPRVIPTLIHLAREDDAQVVDETGRQLQRLTGNNWGLSRSTGKEDRRRIATQLHGWWQEERGNFVPVPLRGQQRPQAAERSRSQQDRWVQELADVDSSVVGAATSALRRQGNAAIPALIRGLSASDGITRNRSRDLLREISGQNFGFEGLRGDDRSRQQAIEAWRNWAREAGHLGE